MVKWINARIQLPVDNSTVWINDVFYFGVTTGHYARWSNGNGGVWETEDGSDDINVSHWAPMFWPQDPTEKEIEEWEDLAEEVQVELKEMMDA